MLVLCLWIMWYPTGCVGSAPLTTTNLETPQNHMSAHLWSTCPRSIFSADKIFLDRALFAHFDYSNKKRFQPKISPKIQPTGIKKPAASRFSFNLDVRFVTTGRCRSADLAVAGVVEQGPCKPTPTEAIKPKRRSPLFLSLIRRSARCPLAFSLSVNPNSDLQDHKEDPQARLYFASEARHHQDQEGRDSSCQWKLHRTCHAMNETEKAAAIAEASLLMKLGVVIKAALRFFLWFLPRSCVSDLCLRPVFRQVGDCLRPVLR